MGLSRIFKEYFRAVSLVFQDWFRGVENEVSKEFQACFKVISG